MAKTTIFKLGEESYNIGNIITYEQQGQVLLGIIQQADGRKYKVLNEKGSELDLPSDRIHKLPRNIPSDITSKDAQLNHLAVLRQSATTELDNFSLEDIWNFVIEEGGEYTTSQLTELYFAEDTNLNHLILRMALLSDAVYFKRKKETFAPRSAETVEELKRAEEARNNKQKKQAKTIEIFSKRLEDPNFSLPESAEEDVELLKQLAASNDDMENGRTNEARQLLATCLEELKLDLQGSREEQAFKLLKKLGLCDQNTNLSLIRHALNTTFSDAVMAEALAITPRSNLSEYPDSSIRLDLTDLFCVTIDDANTQDMDDAITMEKVLGGYRLGVHISDVASVLPLNSLLDKEACKRTTSFYFPTGSIPMLPYELSHAVCSLVAGQNRPCVSCLFELDEAFEIKSVKVTPTLINVKRKYSYEEADELLEAGDEFLNLIYQATATNESKRFANGGFKIMKKSMYVKLLEDGSLELYELDENAPSRAMIGETAVMANEAMANFAAENDFVVAFRGQASPDEDQLVNLDTIPEGLARDYAVRAQLKPSLLSYTPASHHTLGVACYIQATSPIRRYVDLCNQRQILSFVQSGQPMFSSEAFQDLMADSENSRSVAQAVTKESRRFWFLRYLQQRAKKNPFIEATVLRCDRKNPLIELHEVHMPTVIRINRPVNQGDIIKLKITRVNPQFDDLRLEEA